MTKPTNHIKKSAVALPLSAIKIVLVGMLIALSWSLPSQAFFGITARPVDTESDDPSSSNIISLSIPPGETEKEGITITNTTAQQKTLHIFAVDAELLEGGVHVCHEPLSEKKGAGAWLFSDQNVIGAAAGQEQVIDFLVQIPKNVDPGQYHACIFLEEKVMESAPAANERGVFRKGIPVQITVPNQVIQKVDLRSFAIIKKPWRHRWQNEMVFESKLINKGIKQADVKVLIDVKPLFGKPIGAVEAVITIPESQIASWSFGIKPSMWGGFYRTEHIIEYPRVIALVDDKSQSPSDTSATTAYNTSHNLQMNMAQTPNDDTVTASNIVRLHSGSLWFFVMPSLIGILIECVVLAITIVVGYVTYRRWCAGRLLECKICSREVPFSGFKKHSCPIGKNKG